MAVPTRGAPNDVRQLKEFLPNVNIFMQSCLVAVSKPLRLSATDAVCKFIPKDDPVAKVDARVER